MDTNLIEIPENLKIINEDTTFTILNENFKDKKVTVFPVIHCVNPKMDFDNCLKVTFRNVKMCKDEGADGVFLINHSFEPVFLVDIYNAVIKEFPNYWIGCKFLGVDDPLDFCTKNNIINIKGIWNDQGYILDQNDKLYPSWIEKAIKIAEKIKTFSGLYFGGIAVKSQREIKDYEVIANKAKYLISVPTTSGPGTGEAPDTIKLKKLRDGMGEKGILALASGITCENVDKFLPYVNCILVATSICKDFYNFDLAKLRNLIKIDTLKL